jgi:phage-related baseplate assembly protein
MSKSQIDFSVLPAADIIEPIDFEQIYQERKQRFISIAPEYTEALALESDPLSIVMQVESYREMLMRQRINEAVYANLLATAQAGDLDHLGAFYGIKRSGSELDSAYRLRIRDRTIASSTAGSRAHYRSRAIEVNPLAIRDVEVDSPQPGLVRVSVLVRTGFDIPQIVKQVRDHVTSDEVKMLTDTVEVVEAQLIPIAVTADIYLQPGVSELIFDNLKDSLLVAWEKAADLGWDITPSWLDARLHREGIHNVELLSPSQLIPVAANQAVIPGEINLRLKSRGY